MGQRSRWQSLFRARPRHLCELILCRPGPTSRTGTSPFVVNTSFGPLHSSPRPLLEPFLALCCFLIFSRRSLSAFCLRHGQQLSCVPGPVPQMPASACYPQILDMALLLRGRFLGDCVAARLHNGIVQSLVASVGVVILLPTVVGLDHNIA